MARNPTHLPVPLYPPFALATSSPKENKQTNKKFHHNSHQEDAISNQNEMWSHPRHKDYSQTSTGCTEGMDRSCFSH